MEAFNISSLLVSYSLAKTPKEQQECTASRPISVQVQKIAKQLHVIIEERETT